MTLEELEARMDPKDVAEANRLAREAPPLTARQQETLLALFGHLTDTARAA
jgi:hypothetical protein